MSKSLDELPTRAEQDQAEAIQLYRLAAAQGIAGAQCRLGVMYAEGRGVAQNDRESVRWFRLAADQGDAEAQGGLGLAYSTGSGVPQDFVASHMWMTLASAQLTGAIRNGALKYPRYHCGGDDLRADRRSPTSRARVDADIGTVKEFSKK